MVEPILYWAVETGLVQAGICAIIELKKNVQDNHAKQVIIEMLIADLCVSDEIKVFGVLTDLVNTWNFYWIEKERRIKSMCLSHREKVLDLISQLVSTTQKKESKNVTFGNIKVYCEKVKQAFPVKNDSDNDIARIEVTLFIHTDIITSTLIINSINSIKFGIY